MFPALPLTEETKDPSEDSSVKIKGSLYDLFCRL